MGPGYDMPWQQHTRRQPAPETTKRMCHGGNPPRKKCAQANNMPQSTMSLHSISAVKLHEGSANMKRHKVCQCTGKYCLSNFIIKCNNFGAISHLPHLWLKYRVPMLQSPVCYPPQWNFFSIFLHYLQWCSVFQMTTYLPRWLKEGTRTIPR